MKSILVKFNLTKELSGVGADSWLDTQITGHIKQYQSSNRPYAFIEHL
jgi:hypothetical protein